MIDYTLPLGLFKQAALPNLRRADGSTSPALLMIVGGVTQSNQRLLHFELECAPYLFLL
jgi:hypothetical protein